jgi:hypothetical protein
MTPFVEDFSWDFSLCVFTLIIVFEKGSFLLKICVGKMQEVPVVV